MRCSRDARLMFLQMLPFFDDAGTHRADPLELRAAVFPADNDINDKKMVAMIAEHIREKTVIEFTVPDSAAGALTLERGSKYWIIVNWYLHQRIDRPSENARYAIRHLWKQHSGHRDPANAPAFAVDAPAFAVDAPDPIRRKSGAEETTADSIAAEVGQIWEIAGREAARFASLKLLPSDNPAVRNQNRNLVLKICYLTAAEKLPREWIAAAVKQLERAKGKPNSRPGALLTTIYKNKAAEAGMDFTRLLAECPEPPDAAASNAAESAAATNPPPAKSEPNKPQPAAEVLKKAAAGLKNPPRKPTPAEIRSREQRIEKIKELAEKEQAEKK